MASSNIINDKDNAWKQLPHSIPNGGRDMKIILVHFRAYTFGGDWTQRDKHDL